MTQKKSGEATLEKGRRFVQAAGLIFYILAAQGIITAAVGVNVYLDSQKGQDLLLPATGVLLAIAYAFVGYHLRCYRLSARNFAFAFAAISLFAFPIGTILGGLIVLCIDRANRAGVFPQRRKSAPAVPGVPVVEESATLLPFEPAAALPYPTEQAG